MWDAGHKCCLDHQKAWQELDGEERNDRKWPSEASELSCRGRLRPHAAPGAEEIASTGRCSDAAAAKAEVCGGTNK